MSDNVEIIHNVLLDKIKVTSSIFVINIAKIFIERDAFFFFFFDLAESSQCHFSDLKVI